MTNPSAPVLDRQTVNGCGCFADAVPMPMGCAVCGHAPYAHGCPGRAADHEYAPPSGALMVIRLEARRTGDRSLCCFEPPALVAPAEVVPLVPAQRGAGQGPVEVVAPVPALRSVAQASAEVIAPVPAQRPAEQAPAVAPAVPAVPVSLPRRVPCRRRRALPSWSVATRPPRLGTGRRLAARPRRTVGCALHRVAAAPLPHRPPGLLAPPAPLGSPGPYGVPRLVPLRLPTPLRPALRSSGRAFDPLQEVRSMEDAQPTTPRSSIRPESVIPGWRVILSDAGRLWASREHPFSPAAFHAGAERTVDADTIDALRAATDRQESIAQEAHEQAGRVIS
ncbi:hypothetical protein [Streptosporangium sp. NPDC087985]|uniref:hypothetical protein n=1 Tax=Streptosporangium sp. NPDC087985 TaxID=3366196 RepID=UPI003814E4C7